MQYLPYLEEKSWDEQILTPTQQIGMERIEGLPLYSAAYNMMVGNDKHTEDLPAFARYFIGVPSALGGMLVDGVGQIGNTAVNGYKRLYNNAAALYNNAAANIDSRFTPTVTPQTSLTGRKAVTMQAMQPVQYLGNQTFDKLNEQNLDAFRKPQVNASPAIITTNEGIAGNIAPASTQAVIANRMEEAKSKIVKALGDLAVGNQIATAAGKAKAKALIDLYNKIK